MGPKSGENVFIKAGVTLTVCKYAADDNIYKTKQHLASIRVNVKSKCTFF